MRIIKSTILLFSAVVCLASCTDLQKECLVQCENKNPLICNNSCSAVIDNNNYKDYLRTEFVLTGNAGTDNYYALKITGAISFALYDVNVWYKIEGAIGVENTEHSFCLDLGGYGITNSYLFSYNGLLENFTGIKIIEVSGSCSFK